MLFLYLSSKILTQIIVLFATKWLKTIPACPTQETLTRIYLTLQKCLIPLGIQKKQKVNLLNSAERYYIANEVVTKLERINTDIWLLAWQVQYMPWNDLFFGLDPEGWATVMSGKYIVSGLIRQWQYL